jgi:hypothetical protein
MYTSTNFKNKKAIKEAIAAGKRITVYQPNNMFNTLEPRDGTVHLEGPHYPAPHRWYGTGVLKDGYLVSIK